jgi:putative ABC transport system permease protein
MNPLSPLTYYRRHRGSALLQMALIGFATVGLFVLVGVLDAIPLRANVSYLTRLGRVIPVGGTLDPTLVSQIQAHPDVARVIPENGLWITLPTLLGTDSQHLMGISQGDAQLLMMHCGVRIKEGRMFEARSNEFVISEEIARSLNLHIGSKIGREIDQDYYEAIAVPLVLVGILEGDPKINPGASVRMGFISNAYLDSHELYAPRTTSMLVIPMEGREAAVDNFLEKTIRSKYTEVETFSLLVNFLRMARIAIYVIFGMVNSIVAVAVSFVVGIVNRIAITNRLNELGLLHALGRHKKRLIRRLTLETGIVAGIGWVTGLGLALLIMLWVKNTLFYNLGMELDLINLAPFCFVIPIPLIVVALTFLSIRKIFSSLDAVAIIERGKLSMEDSQGKPTTERSYEKALSPLTFSLRHRRRGALMILSTALMVLSITIPVFLLSAITSAMKPYYQYLQEVSVIQRAAHSELNPGVIGQVKSHPAVAHTIVSIPLSIQMILPPGGTTDVPVFGISETEFPDLLESFDVYLDRGRLPQTGSNEIVLSSAIAVNRDLHIGDLIGGETDTDDSLIEDNIPVEMEIVGILSPDRPWVGFASYEYLNAHELTSSRGRRWIIVPHEGEKQALDTWLAENVDSTQAQVVLYQEEEREFREMTTSLVLTFAMLECMIAGVAAIALSALNYIFFTQRKTEFGILNAMGYSRLWLVWRTMKETISMIGIAWVLGAVLCGIGLFIIHYFFYAPRGLTLNFFNLTPWLLTLSIPLAIFVSSAGVVAIMLRKLDPVSIIERR